MTAPRAAVAVLATIASVAAMAGCSSTDTSTTATSASSTSASQSISSTGVYPTPTFSAGGVTDPTSFSAKYADYVRLSCMSDGACYQAYAKVLNPMQGDLAGLPVGDAQNLRSRVESYFSAYGQYVAAGCTTDDSPTRCVLTARTGLDSSIRYIQQYVATHR